MYKRFEDNRPNNKINKFLSLKEDEIYYFSYTEDLNGINKKLNTYISFYGSGSIMDYTRIFVNDALVSLDYEPVSAIYGIVIKLKKNDFNKLFEYENNNILKSKIIEKLICCQLYNDNTNKVENHMIQISTFMKIGSNNELKLKRMPIIDEMLKIRQVLNMRLKINKEINKTPLYIKGYYFQEENNNDLYLYGIFTENYEIESSIQII